MKLATPQLVQRQVGGHLEQESPGVIELVRLFQPVQSHIGFLGQFRGLLTVVELARQVFLQGNTVLCYQRRDELVFAAAHGGIMPLPGGPWPPRASLE